MIKNNEAFTTKRTIMHWIPFDQFFLSPVLSLYLTPSLPLPWAYKLERTHTYTIHGSTSSFSTLSWSPNSLRCLLLFLPCSSPNAFHYPHCPHCRPTLSCLHYYWSASSHFAAFFLHTKLLTANLGRPQGGASCRTKLGEPRRKLSSQL